MTGSSVKRPLEDEDALAGTATKRPAVEELLDDDEEEETGVFRYDPMRERSMAYKQFTDVYLPTRTHMQITDAHTLATAILAHMRS